MATLRHIRRRIKSVRTTQKITRVMKMVAAAKLARSQTLAQEGKAYADELERILREVVQGRELEHALLASRPVERRGLLVVTSDRGLCGGYNNNVIGRALEALKEAPRDTWSLFCVGKKGRDWFRRRGWNLAFEVVDTRGNVTPDLARHVAAALTDAYASGSVDEVRIAYTTFQSAAKYFPVVNRFLPLRPAGVGGGEVSTDYIFEPDLATVVDRLLPDYIQTTVFTALLEASAAEHAARMMAMQNATENAKDVIHQLTLEMNKARQAAITKELADITGAMLAVEG